MPPHRLSDPGPPSSAAVPGSSGIEIALSLMALPGPLRERTAAAAAADRFYRATQRSWWFSLFWNTYPIARGGGDRFKSCNPTSKSLNLDD